MLNLTIRCTQTHSFSPPSSDRLPKEGEENVLITSALPYVNNVPHLGNIIGSVLSADVFSRYCRVRGKNVLYVCGTDEYGTATETKALSEGVTCQELCDKFHKLHADVYKWFQVDFDIFGRTSTQAQTDIAQDIFLKLQERNYTFESSMDQLHCASCNRFLADRFVEGTCPKCSYSDARGDQCDGCGNLLNAPDLINPRCKLDNSTPTIRTSTHQFLDLSRLQPKCEAFVEKSSKEGKWSSNGLIITTSWLKEGLQPRCITRDLHWGSPVPVPGYEKKVFYVWYDAPIGYPSITACYTPKWEEWWKNPDNVKLYQFMGKDNVPFHTVIFPSCLIGTDDPWTLLHHISTTEYLNYEDAKFSKSRGVGVFGDNAQATGIPPSVWRYYLLSSRPETGDTIFTWKDLIQRNNSELLATVGNLVNRVMKFLDAANKYNGVLPEFTLQPEAGTEGGEEEGKAEAELITKVNDLISQYIQQLDAVQIRAGLRTAMEVAHVGNVYLQDNRLDNTLFAEHRPQCDRVLGVSINLIYLLGSLLYPYMPETSDAIWRQLGAPARRLLPTWTAQELRGGHPLGKPEYLFTRIDPKM
ncbi:methionyl-tRNA synthetase [Piptocephalis cylindrospora]|uniref:methionine--tRNA ligase n=1 Tax=Piptocephalis cylindrospora TaxID=1907219 RepID=A0A4P9Y708_9FUNG|nr:methionyl-tRNA synthetase [Piptocephalis cylindrospora]|eukprot:RKP14602.1 methionyl-tRNA synthetase [Piptocephalis cylindrospora]